MSAILVLAFQFQYLYFKYINIWLHIQTILQPETDFKIDKLCSLGAWQERASWDYWELWTQSTFMAITRWLRESFGVDLTWLNVKKCSIYCYIASFINFCSSRALDLEFNPFAGLQPHIKLIVTNDMFKNIAKKWHGKLVLKSFQFHV